MNIAQVIKYEGDNKTFVWKHQCEDFNTSSQLIVHESQEAVFFMNGQALDLFRAGRYTLTTQNIPLLGKAQRIPTDGESPFHCEVYFVNKTVQMAMKWGTDRKVEYIEPTYKFPISIGASGEMRLSVADSRELLVRLVGTESVLSQDQLVSYFRGILMKHVKSYIAEVMRTSKINIFEVDEHLIEFSDALLARLAPDFLKYGVNLVGFDVSTIVKPDGETNYERYKNIFFEQSIGVQEEVVKQQKDIIHQQTASQRIIMESAALAKKREQEGYTFQQEQAFEVAKSLAQNEGVGNFSTMGIGMGTMVGIGGGVGAAMANLTSQAMQPIMGGQFPNSPGVPANGAVDGLGVPTIDLKKQNEGDIGVENVPPMNVGSLPTLQERLANLKMMQESGMFSEEEIAAKRKEILDAI